MTPSPKFHLVTYGCQMNKNDSERIAGLLAQLGFIETDNENEADFILLNTCSVRQSAEERIYGKMKDYLFLKEKRPEVIIAVTGCMPGRDKKRELKQRLRPVDLYFPTAEMVNLPRWIAELRPDLVNSDDQASDYLKINPRRSSPSQGFVTIQTGCNKFCSYCVVPYARGLEKNRLLADILQEARGMAESGVLEITLLGQTVNSYRAPDPENFSRQNPYSDKGFAALLWELNQISGPERIHWTAAHPNSMSDEVIDALCLPKQVNYLHLPVQSGSNEILSKMNRKYTREQYLEIIAKVKAARPEIALGTDIIVGFSGESAAHFEETVSLYKEVDFDISYNARYSPRSGTLACKLFIDDVPKDEKKRRWNVLQDLMEETAKRKNQAFVGREVMVLVEKIEDGFAFGNTNEMKTCRFKCADAGWLGKIAKVRIKLAHEWQITGDMLR